MSIFEPISVTCQPRKDVLSGSLTDEHFAADLDDIVRDPASYPVYGNPDEFFALTHPTKGLRDLLSRTFARLSGTKGIAGTEHGVLRPQTVFGGGKTHGLIALYHLAKGARPTEIDRFVDVERLPPNCQVAAAVGDKFNPVDGISTRLGDTDQTVTTYTLWGDIAAQLGATAWDAVKGADAARTAPGSETWAKAIGPVPTIIIIDEIAQHIRQCATSGDENVRRQAQAIPVFLKSLFQHAAASPNVVVVVSLATHADAYGRETTALEKILDEHIEAAEDAASDVRSILARQQTIIRPAEDAEIAEILKTRLFASIDSQSREAVLLRWWSRNSAVTTAQKV
jgi:predicted AAA+ superfamily ATPase